MAPLRAKIIISVSYTHLDVYKRQDLYSHRGTLPNNFAQTLPDTKQALKAVCSFKDEYLLDFINVEELDEQEEDLDEKIVEKSIVANVKDVYKRQLLRWEGCNFIVL